LITSAPFSIGDRIGASGTVDQDGVVLSVPGNAAERPGEVDIDLLEVGTGEIIHRDAVVSAEGMEIDGLDIIHVHLDAGDVAGEQNMPVTRP
jgi:hypothetical protein